MFRFFERLADPYCAYDDTQDPPQSLYRFLREYARPFTKIFAVTAALSVVVAIVEIWLISYLGRLVDLLEGVSPQAFWQTNRTELVAVTLFILVLRPLLQASHTALLNNAILPNFPLLIRWRAHKQVMRQSVGWFENDFAGRIANRVSQTPPAAGEVIFQLFDAITFALAYVVGAGVLLAQADPRLVAPLVLWGLPYAILLVWVIRRIGPASEASSDARSKFNGRVVDSYTNIHSVKMFAHHDLELAFAREATDHIRNTFIREMRLYTIMDIALVGLNGFLVVGLVGASLFFWTQGTGSVGLVAASAALSLRLNAMSGWIMWAVSDFFRELGVVREGMETIAQPVTLLDAPNAGVLVPQNGGVEFDQLSHHYGRESGGLDRVSLEIAPGEKVGLVGPSGAGKSTLVKLLLRFYDSESGQIRIDGQDVSQVTQDSLRQAIGVVQQESTLLHRSVRDNIRYGRPEATEAEIVAAAEEAQAHDFILTLQDNEGNQGYDAKVGERGVKLSGGQRQRIALARVILKDAPILVLDEATSALDSEVEAAIQETLYRMIETKTVIAVAHRLSTIAQMDRIIVLDQGRVVEDGTHEALLRENGLYARLWHRQAGGFMASDVA